MSYIPYVIEMNGRTEKSYDIFARMMKDRVIMLTGEVEENMATGIVSQLLYLESQDSTKPIYMYINSPGGSVTAGLSIHDTMKFIESPVYTIAMGEACSMGSFLLTAGDKRFSLPNTSLMYHSVSSGFMGTVHDHEISFAETKRLQELLLSTIIDNAKRVNKELDENFVREKITRDWWLTAEQAEAFGLIDKVITNKGDVKGV